MFEKEFKELEKIDEEILLEDSELYKGIFWIVDENNISNNKDYCFKILSNTFGEVQDINIELNAKSGSTYNHEKTWKELPSSMTHNKAYNYYPRGRVEINRGIAKIFINPLFNRDDVKEFLIKEFNLTNHNGIKDVKMLSDGSQHYKCHLEDGWKELR